MTPNEAAEIALSSLHPCPLSDDSYAPDKERLVRRALLDYADNTQVLSRVAITTQGQTVLAFPADLRYITDVSDANGEYLDHEATDTEVTVILETRTAYPIWINYAVNFSAQDLNAQLPKKVQASLLVDLIGAYFGQKNDAILQTARIANVEIEPKDYSDEIRAIKERIAQIPVLLEPKVF